MKKNVRRLSIEVGAKLKECLREEPDQNSSRDESNTQRDNPANSQGFTFDTPEQSENQEQPISNDEIVCKLEKATPSVSPSSPPKETDSTPSVSPSSPSKETDATPSSSPKDRDGKV